MSRPSRSQLREALEPVVAAAGLYLEDVTVTAGRRALVRAVVDLPDGAGGVGSDELTEVSRQLSAALDEHDPLAGGYTLEVTTPGASRPLTEPRHYRRAVGRLLRAQTTAGPLRGRVLGVAGNTLTIETATGEQQVDLDTITGARVEPELAARPQDG